MPKRREPETGDGKKSGERARTRKKINRGKDPERQLVRSISRSPVLRWILIVATVLIAVLILLRYLGVPMPWTQERSAFSVMFIDVGQGDCTLILTKDTAVVVDVGPASSAERTSDYLSSRTDKIDCVIVTHPHEDHMGALPTVLEEIPTDLLIMNSDASDGAFFTKTLDVIERKNIRAEEAKDGAVYRYGDLTIELFCPVTDAEDKNENSVVVRASVPGASVLITGDATVTTEEAILAGGREVRSDILKVGHHGSSTSTSEAFLEAVSPQIAVISCGEGNSYGHPHDVTLGRLDNAGVTVFRTDRNGTVTVYLENGVLKVKTSE